MSTPEISPENSGAEDDMRPAVEPAKASTLAAALPWLMK